MTLHDLDAKVRGSEGPRVRRLLTRASRAPEESANGRAKPPRRPDACQYRALQGAREHWLWRHGGGLQGVRSADQAHPRDQDHSVGHPAAEPSIQVVHRALLPRGADLGDTRPPEHRHPLRHRRGRGSSLPGHGVRGGGDDRRPAREGRALQARARDRTREPGGRRPRLRAHEGRHPSGHQALEPHPARRGAGQGHGLRDREAGGCRDDPVGHPSRHAFLHVARAGHGGEARRPQRHLLPRGVRVRDAVGRAAVPGDQRHLDPLQARPRRSHRAREPRDARPRAPEMARGLRPGPGQEAGRPLPDRRRLRAGPRVLPGRVVRGRSASRPSPRPTSLRP